MSAKRRRYALLAGALLVAVLAWLLLREREPKWSIALQAEQDPVTPWREMRIQANVKPTSAIRSGEKWHWSWQADSTPLPSHEPRAAWRTGDHGEHTITVTVESEWGTRRTASVKVDVRPVAYISPMAGKMEPPPPPPASEELPFGFADVWIEKDEVCQGEPSRIRVTARDKRGEEKWLTPVIDGRQTWEETFIVPLSEPGMRMVPVSLTDSRMHDGGTISTSAFIMVKDCVARFPLYLHARPVPPDESYVGFEARIFDGPAWQEWARHPGERTVPLATAASYRWTFGDGTTATSTTQTIRHRYPPEGDRSEERATLYAASVDALDVSGNKMATGYATVEIANTLRALKREQGLVQLVTEQAPGAQDGSEGSRSIDVTLINIDSVETARLTELVIRFKPCDGSDAPETAWSLQSVFSNTRIPPKGRITGRLTLSAKEAEGVCWADARVAGESEPGQLKVTGFFGLDTGHSKGMPLTAEAQETMNQALKLLGKANKGGSVIVTDEDIRRLEDDGKIPRGVLRPDPFVQPKPR